VEASDRVQTVGADNEIAGLKKKKRRRRRRRKKKERRDEREKTRGNQNKKR
jgi:hypothetical protein